MAKLGFRQGLNILSELFGSNEFSSRQASDRLTQLYASDPEMIHRVRREQISSDLCRIKDMKFLASRRVPRQVRTKTGKVGYKSFEKLYRITNQGRKYLAWLANPTDMQLTKSVEDVLVARMIAETPPEERPVWLAAYRRYVRKGPGDRRFASSERLRDKVIEAVLAKEDKRQRFEQSERLGVLNSLADLQGQMIDLLFTKCKRLEAQLGAQRERSEH